MKGAKSLMTNNKAIEKNNNGTIEENVDSGAIPRNIESGSEKHCSTEMK